MYYIVYAFLYLISLIPLRILYIASDGVYGVIYYILRYRRNVVMNNLSIAFPEKTEAEKIKIAKKFYRNFTDTFLETIKMISVDDNFILKHFTGNWDVINDLEKTGKSCYFLIGHTFNWEWGNHSIGINFNYMLLVVYMPISNKVVDRLFIKMRSKGNIKLLSAHNVGKEMLRYRNNQYIMALAADQNPGDPKYAYWLNFFGRPAPFVTGPEKGARPRNLPVIFCYIEKLRRGYYNMVLSMGEENPKQLPEGALTVKFVRYLENIIRLHPDMWLWSHKRWKHEWKDEYQKLWVDQDPPAVSVTQDS